MSEWLALLLAGASSVVKTRAALRFENVALGHQVVVLQRSATKRPRLQAADLFLGFWPSRLWSGWRSSLTIVKPSSPDTATHFVCSGRGRFGEASPGVPRSHA